MRVPFGSFLMLVRGTNLCVPGILTSTLPLTGATSALFAVAGVGTDAMSPVKSPPEPIAPGVATVAPPEVQRTSYRPGADDSGGSPTVAFANTVGSACTGPGSTATCAASG